MRHATRPDGILPIALALAAVAIPSRATVAQSRPATTIEKYEAKIIEPARPSEEVKAEPSRSLDRPDRAPNRGCPAPRAGNAVEPLSDGFQLHWTKAQAQEAMGGRQTGWDPRTLQFGGANVMFGGAREVVWHYTIQSPGLCLNSGIGVGSTMDDVRRAFGVAYPSTYDQYKLQVRYSGSTVREIQIDPVSEFAPLRTRTRTGSTGGGDGRAPSPAPEAARGGVGALVGDWYLTQSPSQITIGRDGSYTSSAGGRGTVRVRGAELTFTGPLAAWNGGRATLTDKGYIEFYWKTAEGATNWFTFIRR